MNYENNNSHNDATHANPPAIHHLRWKGKITGPYTRAQITELLRRGEISLLHSVEENGEWRGLGDFLNHSFSSKPRLTSAPQFPAPNAKDAPAVSEQDQPPPPPPPAPRENGGFQLRFDSPNTGYLLCGLCFLFPFLATIPALLTAIELNEQPDPAPKHAKKILILAITFTIAGTLFLYFCYFAAKNWL